MNKLIRVKAVGVLTDRGLSLTPENSLLIPTDKENVQMSPQVLCKNAEGMRRCKV